MGHSVLAVLSLFCEYITNFYSMNAKCLLDVCPTTATAAETEMSSSMCRGNQPHGFCSTHLNNFDLRLHCDCWRTVRKWK